MPPSRLPPRFRLTPLSEPGLDQALETRGYAVDDPAVVMVAPVPEAPEADPAVPPCLGGGRRMDRHLLRHPPRRRRPTRRAGGHLFPAGSALCVRRSWATTALSRKERSPLCRWRAVPPQDVAPDAVGLGVIDGDLVCILDVATRQEMRGRGLARRLVGTLLALGPRAGARGARCCRSAPTMRRRSRSTAGSASSKPIGTIIASKTG